MNYAYLGYMLFFGVLITLIFLTPIIARVNNADTLYSAFSLTCHQKLSRSLCLFEDLSIEDCTKQNGEYIENDRNATSIQTEKGTGYKIPVCSRDIGLYLALFLGGLVYILVRRLDDKTVYPGIFLVIAMIPIGLDGGIQLLSEIGILPFIYESTNLIRLITGAIAGFVAAFYAIPMIINIFSKD